MRATAAAEVEITERRRLELVDLVSAFNGAEISYVTSAMMARLIADRGVEGAGEVVLAGLAGAHAGAIEYLKERWLAPLVEGFDAAEMIGNLAPADFDEIFGAAIARIIRERGTTEGGALVREALEGAIQADEFMSSHFDTGRG